MHSSQSQSQARQLTLSQVKVKHTIHSSQTQSEARKFIRGQIQIQIQSQAR
jgi:hypothetical protein